MAQQQKATDSISILSVVWYKVLPPKFGGQKGVALFNEHLGRIAPLTCLCSRNNKAIPASYEIDFRLPVSKWQVLNPLCWRKIYLTAKNKKTSHLILEFPYYGIAGYLCKKFLPLKLVIHSHNIEAFRFREQKKWWWRLLFSFEKWTFQNADAIFLKTEQDRQTLLKHYNGSTGKTKIIPYGVVNNSILSKDAARKIVAQKHPLKKDEKLLLFAGTLDYLPNAEAVMAIHKILIPLLNQKGLHYRIVVCGRNESEEFSHLKKLQHENLIYAGNVTDIDSYFSAADLFLNPVFTGGGIQTKILDALSYHLNVVCFGEMAVGITGAENKIFTAPLNNWDLFAGAVLKAVNHSEPTPQAFFDYHHWQKIAEKAYKVLQET